MLNKLQLIGHVGQDPRIVKTENGIILHFSLATTKPAYKNEKDQVIIPERTTWHRINVFGKLAEQVKHSICKGAKLYCEGSLEAYEYAVKDTGEIRQSLEMDCRYIEYLSPIQQTPRQALEAIQPPATPPAPEDIPKKTK